MTLTEVKNPLVIDVEEDHDWLNMLIYGDPGAGKTYFTGTAEDDPRTKPVLILDIDGGTRTIKDKLTTKTHKGIDRKRIRTLDQIVELYNQLYHSIKDGRIYYKTIGVDNLSELADLDMKTIMKAAYDKSPDRVDIDVPSQREWGKARTHMRNIVRAFRDLPCNVIFTAHVATLQEENQPTKYFPGFAGKLKTDIPGFVDVVGYLRGINEQGTIVRKLQIQGTNRVVAKDRTSRLGMQLDDATIPMIWDLISSADQVNSKTAA